MKKISVLGAGAWGTTLAILLAEAGNEVTLWAFEKEVADEINLSRENKSFLPGFQVPENITITNKSDITKEADLYFIVVPTQFLRSVCQKFKKIISPEKIIVSASKGIELNTLKLPLEIIEEELGHKKLVALSGPNLSKEIAQGLPAAAVAAANDPTLAKTVQETLMLERFRVYASQDPLGVELGGALKNVIAIAAGVVDGFKLGNNATASLIIRGMAEISRLGKAMGAKPATFMGLSGMGDLITTCGSKLSRNHCVGEQISQGKKLKDILASMKSVAEGVATAKAAQALAKKYQVDMPVTNEIYKVLYEDKNPLESINDLMTRNATSE
ncbi:glycerol-3-phosphate dehydrogenase [Candidatus Saganbacteria bacterium CG08_land_8_20_14_0_20_45_16]|uniref:Glycerol-3-phosphate dehydrogenase [NAD(P)+] n=1 Tax=Candidatus Saganbacteria bacterium CG08_land_8_20_14_0_20_45_16 TaxID=2014293 RepID=A0A2H0XTM9_UNCSA|nr:MAG: glycerol-3-phosphate dehydrogenase [Candidatus Saganbacteria bacterium CG08_land_8_20_14_0_20_45_16]